MDFTEEAPVQPNKTSATKRSHRSADQWEALLNRFEQSNLTIKDFCKKENISRGTFSRWRIKLLKESGLPGFIELHPTVNSSPGFEAWSLDLDLPGGGHFRLRCGQ